MKRKKTRKRRTRAQRAQALRRREALVTETAGSELPDATETTEPKQAAGGLLTDPRRIRSDLILLRKHMGAGGFSDDQIDALFSRIMDIALSGKPREALGAAKVLLAQTKLSHDMAAQQEKETKPQQVHTHAHVHTAQPANGIGADFIEIAHALGISIDVESVDRLEGTVIDANETPEEARERGPQQEKR